jgi:hypothetical protein
MSGLAPLVFQAGTMLEPCQKNGRNIGVSLGLLLMP